MTSPATDPFDGLLDGARRAQAAGDRETAVDSYRRALDQRPDHVAARVALGRLLLAAGDAVAARRELFLALQHDPDQMVARRLLVDANIALGDDLEAHRWLVEYLGVVGDDEEARGLLAEVEPRLPSVSPLRTRTLGKLYLEQGHAEEAARVFAGLADSGHQDAELRTLTEQAGGALARQRHTGRLLERLRAWQRVIEQVDPSVVSPT